jgi:N-acetylglucosamine-6-phosphate deacetylase
MDPMTSALADIHCHGALGHEFGASAAGSRSAVAHHLDAGTDTVVASLVSGTDDRLLSQVDVLSGLVADGIIAGIHLEGPFLSDARRGAHDPAALRDPDERLVEALVARCADAGVARGILQWTFAPERAGSGEFVNAIVRQGIRPAVGHTDADAETVSRCLSAIAEAQGSPALVTHLFNGMPPFHHRAGGPVSAALGAAARGEAFVELIADGVHVSPDVVRMVFETVGPDAVVLVSDAMAATGLGDGAYTIGTLDVDVTAGVARLAGGGSIAGSTSTLADCVRWCIDVAGLDETDVLTAASLTPRRALGLAP